MNKNISPHNIREAWVVFSGKADMNWLKLLKPGFRHCYLIINDGRHWMTIDPLSSHLDVTVNHVPADFNLPLWMKDRGAKIIKAPISRDRREAPWMLFTCVEAVKRVLGIHKRWIITPWQLYRHIINLQLHPKGDLAWEV